MAKPTEKPVRETVPNSPPVPKVEQPDPASPEFQKEVREEIAKETDQYPETQYDAAVVDAARVVFEDRMDAIAAAVTHEDVDAL